MHAFGYYDNGRRVAARIRSGQAGRTTAWGVFSAKTNNEKTVRDVLGERRRPRVYDGRSVGGARPAARTRAERNKRRCGNKRAHGRPARFAKFELRCGALARIRARARTKKKTVPTRVAWKSKETTTAHADGMRIVFARRRSSCAARTTRMCDNDRF